MGSSAVILAGGLSSRFGQDKGLTQLAGKPLVKYVFTIAGDVADERIVVVSSEDQVGSYTRVLGSGARVVVDTKKEHSPLLGALTGLRESHCELALLLSCDVPFVSRDVLSLLLELVLGRNAAIPRWPNGFVEPLQAAYRVEAATKAAEEALNEGMLNLKSMVEKMRHVRYISTLALQQLDADLRTFFNINSLANLKKAELMLTHERT